MTIMTKFSAFLGCIMKGLFTGADETFPQGEMFLDDYARKYGVLPKEIEQMIKRRALKARMIEGLWVVEDKPPVPPS